MSRLDDREHILGEMDREMGHLLFGHLRQNDIKEVLVEVDSGEAIVGPFVRLRAEVSIRGPEGTDWISTDDRLPAEDGYYLVWVPEWEGYGNIAHADMCWWGGHGWHMGCLPSVEDGAPVSHWATITVPKEDK